MFSAVPDSQTWITLSTLCLLRPKISSANSLATRPEATGSVHYHRPPSWRSSRLARVRDWCGQRYFFSVRPDFELLQYVSMSPKVVCTLPYPTHPFYTIEPSNCIQSFFRGREADRRLPFRFSGGISLEFEVLNLAGRAKLASNIPLLGLER